MCPHESRFEAQYPLLVESVRFFCSRQSVAENLAQKLRRSALIFLALCASVAADETQELFKIEVTGLRVAGELLRPDTLCSEKYLELLRLPSDSEWDVQIGSLTPKEDAIVLPSDQNVFGFLVTGSPSAPDASQACVMYGALICSSLDTKEVWLRQYHGLLTAVGERGMSVQGWRLPAGKYEVTVLLLIQERPNGKITLAATQSHKFSVIAPLTDDEFDREVVKLRSTARDTGGTIRSADLWKLLASSSLSARNWKTIAEIEELAALDLSGLRLSIDAARAIKALTHLRDLRIDDSACSVETWDAIAIHSELRQLSARRSTSRPGWMAHLKNKSEIQKLDLSYHTLDGNDIFAISNALQLSDLNLSHSKILKAIPVGTLDQAAELREVNVSYSSLQDRDLRVILSNPSLVSVNLSHTVVTDDLFVSLPILPSAERVDLSSTGITEIALARVALAPKLKRLTLDAKLITSPSIAQLKSRGVEVRFMRPPQNIWAELWKQLN
jgi:hypothetical protein